MSRQPINVAASIIADVSAGIYRSPAGALKELISNAFDADAASVRISTGEPEFRTFTCTDDGRGIRPEEFTVLMGHIGGSTKRDQGDTSSLGRPLIGRIGIGLLSIAQICRRFVVISSAEGHPKKFRANIDLDPYMLAEARRATLGHTIDTDQGKVRIGDYEIEESEEDPEKHYTRIVMERIDNGFRTRLTDKPQLRGGFSPKKFIKGTIEDFLEIVERATVAEHGAYAQMVWELAITAPVRYLDDGPIRGFSEINQLRQRLQDYGFKAYLDGVELRKPIRLPSPNSTIEHRVYPLALDTKLTDKRRLNATGYLYWQKGRILPRELQGILVRVKNVAIGQFDSTYLGYPHHEGFKFSQMMGELYVDRGLDEAVNIDRASFRESDEAFLELQAFLFEKLKGGTDEGAGIFSDIKRETTKLRLRARHSEERKRQRITARLITGRDQPLRMARVSSESMPSGVTVRGAALKIDEKLLAMVPNKHHGLFIAITGIVESELGDAVSKERRKRIYLKLAELLQSF